MEYTEFEREINKIVKIVRFEDKLEAISAEYPPMSLVAAELLEYAVTGVMTDDGLISWWMYALNCGESDGSLYMPDGKAFNIKTIANLWGALNNKELYNAVINTQWEQMEIEM